MKKSVNLYEPSVIQLEIPGLFEQLEKPSDTNSKTKYTQKLKSESTCEVKIAQALDKK